ncbi:hypothetical protein VTN77DRAFT_4313 [Rasamsonia byssochlamydoides]|uniref:uncharacterized protein n=1 Tax=Rasamsonia byssochlamydoides TaxID=89139 RepID=UPI003743F535
MTERDCNRSHRAGYLQLSEPPWRRKWEQVENSPHVMACVPSGYTPSPWPNMGFACWLVGRERVFPWALYDSVRWRDLVLLYLNS